MCLLPFPQLSLSTRLQEGAALRGRITKYLLELWVKPTLLLITYMNDL